MLDVRVPSKLHFRLLGRPTLAAGDSDTIRISSLKGFALLAYLAMNPGRPISRSVLADLLWSDRGETQARQNLRQSILTLRRDLKTVHSVILQTDDQSVGLAADATEVDALQFAAWASNADPAVRMRCLDIPWGSFLDGFSVESEAFDEWVVAERQRLDAIATRTFSELAAQLTANGDGERAILALERLVALDPADEERHRRLISLEARFRGRDAALTRAKSLTAMLKRELDAEPETATRKLVDDIRRMAVEPAKPAVAVIARPPVEPIERPHPIAQADSPAATSPLPAAAQPRRVGRRALAAGAAGLVLLLGGGLLALWQANAPLWQRAGSGSPTAAGDHTATTDTGTAALVVKGWAAHHAAGRLGAESHNQAMQYFSNALERDRENISAKTGLAAVLVSMAVQGTAQDSEASLAKAEGLLREARDADPLSVAAHYYMGIVHRARGQKKDAIESFERAIALNPSHASSYANLGFVLAMMGRPAEGLEHIRYAMRLSPKDPIFSHWLYYAGRAELELERYPSAVDRFRESLKLQPTYQSSYVGLAAAHALSGQPDAARTSIAELQKLAPQISRDRLLARFGTEREGRRSRMAEGLRIALGIPSASSWQSPPLPSQRADDAVAPGRGLVAIAVLPFATYDETSNGRSLVAEMVTDDLTYLLSRIPAFRVISRQTMMSYRGQTIDAGKLGTELGVHYLLEGNASMRGTALRVTVSLIDARTRLHVWSGSFERAGQDRDALQTEIVKSVGRELQFSVMAVEGARASSHPDVNELIFRGYAAIGDSRRYGVEGLRPAEKYFRQALERDPGAVRATIGLAAFHVHMGLQLFAPDPKPHLDKAEEILRPILVRHPHLTEAHAHMGLVHVARADPSKAITSFERVIALNPSHAPSYAQLGRQLVRIGRAKEGLAHIHYAMKLSPRDPIIGYWQAFAGYAELELGNYDAAVGYLERAHASNPTQPRTLLTLISATALAGNLDLARERLALLMTLHPHLSRERVKAMYLKREQRRHSRVAAGILRVLSAETAGAATSPH